MFLLSPPGSLFSPPTERLFLLFFFCIKINKKQLWLNSYYLIMWHCIDYCCSVAQLCLTLLDPMDCSTPGFPVLHHLPEFAQTHVHRVSDAIQPSHPLWSPSLIALCLSLFLKGSLWFIYIPRPTPVFHISRLMADDVTSKCFFKKFYWCIVDLQILFEYVLCIETSHY